MYWYWVDAAHIKPLSQSTDQTEDKVVVAYVTSWSKVMPDPKYMTHINYAFGHVNETFDGVGIANPERLQQIVKLKENAPKLGSADFLGGRGYVKSIVLSLQNETRPTAQSNPTGSPDRQLRH